VRKHLKQVAKAVRIAAVISPMTVKRLLKLAAKVVRTATAAAVAK
jgi:hypothetical protein